MPFRSIRITYQKPSGAQDSAVWLIVRGTEGLPAYLGNGLTLPYGARLQTQARAAQLQPLDFYDLASAPKGTHGKKK